MKINAQHLMIFAVYEVCYMFGEPARFFKVAFPNRCQAEDWVNSHTASKYSKFMVEEMPAIMKAWTSAS